MAAARFGVKYGITIHDYCSTTFTVVGVKKHKRRVLGVPKSDVT